MESIHTAAHAAGFNKKHALAIDPALGTVFVCGACRHIHLQIEAFHVRFDLDCFQSLVVLLNRAAANFELWAEGAGRAA